MTQLRVCSSNRLATLDILDDLERQRRRISFDSVVNYDFEYNANYFELLDKHIKVVSGK